MKYKTPADQKAIEAEKQYDDLVDRIKHLRQTAVEANQRITEMQADVDGDVALLTKQSIKEKRQAEEAETEVSILLQRLAPIAEKVGAALHESRQEWRQISNAYDTAVDQATETALQDNDLLLGVEKLKALLHSVKYPRVIMDQLGLTEDAINRGEFRDEFNQHGFEVEYPTVKARESRLEAIANFHTNPANQGQFYDRTF